MVYSFLKEAIYIIRHAGSGVINTITGFGVIFYAMRLGFSPAISNAAGFSIGFILGFLLSKKFVFRSNGHFVGETVRYTIAFIVSFIFNLLVLHLAIDYLFFNPATSQIAAASCYTLLMYILTRLFVFNTTRDKGVKS
jgi:putative flippase GtrA